MANDYENEDSGLDLYLPPACILEELSSEYEPPLEPIFDDDIPAIDIGTGERIFLSCGEIDKPAGLEKKVSLGKMAVISGFVGAAAAAGIYCLAKSDLINSLYHYFSK